MKKKLSLLLVIAVLSALMTACGTQSTPANTAAPAANTTAPEAGSRRILVVCFSYFDNTDGENITSQQYADALSSASVTVVDGKRRGNNDVVADTIRAQTGADLFSIRTEEPYPSDYDGGFVQQMLQDNKDHRQPVLASQTPDLSQYDTVVLLYPIWWYDLPMAVYAFLDAYDLSGKTVAPVATSGGSGLVDTVSAIRKAEPGATVKAGLAIRAEDAASCGPAVASWLTQTGIAP